MNKFQYWRKVWQLSVSIRNTVNGKLQTLPPLTDTRRLVVVKTSVGELGKLYYTLLVFASGNWYLQVDDRAMTLLDMKRTSRSVGGIRCSPFGTGHIIYVDAVPNSTTLEAVKELLAQL